ncbi:MAG TPA: GNAT family N-acetyltransferase [Nocardiopsis listeri]|uniref:GNAT family N-acetyltransferase n=1 Tax=Nocardiopsis listeri TaxID=53440 RepID=UPI001D7DB73C|nr:GNAT family N-acetyltransferase [Nocardiopsis listeri]HJE57345.1 GNAT family N-acetyltransferase [Nocardiopsis listeri]
MRRSGIDQWAPGKVTPQQVRARIDRGQWWVLWEDFLAGAVRVVESDPQVWPEPGPVPARYVHGLMVGHEAAGRRLGEAMLAWVEGRAAGAGCGLVRLDRVAANPGLCAYYERLGYRPRGRTSFPEHLAWHPVMRYEKPVTRTP